VGYEYKNSNKLKKSILIYTPKNQGIIINYSPKKIQEIALKIIDYYTSFLRVHPIKFNIKILKILIVF